MSDVITFHDDVALKCYQPYLDDKTRFLLFWGTRGSGKSTFIAQKLIKDCLELKHFRCVLVRERLNTIKDSQWKVLHEFVHNHGLEDLFTFTKNPLEIRCVNGNEFLARGCEDVARLKSITEPTHAWYEETDKIKLDDFNIVSTSIRSSKAEYLQEILSFNPECEGRPEDFWLYKKFFEGKSGNTFDSHIQTTVKGKPHKQLYKSIWTTYHDNEYCTDDEIASYEALKYMNPYLYEVYNNGLWAQRELHNLFATAYDKNKHESTEAVLRPNMPLYVSMDFNLNPFGFIFYHKWRDKDGEHCHVVDEATIFDAKIHDAIDYIKTKYHKYIPSMEITGDKMGDRRDMGQRDHASYYLQIARGIGLSDHMIKTPANPKHENSRADSNYFLHHFDDFKINPNTCPNLCRDMVSVQVDNFNSIIKTNRKEINQRADHLDCFRYMINKDFHHWVRDHQKFGR